MTYRGTTKAWPTCDPYLKKCNGGKLTKENMVKRYEWACFDEHKRGQVGYFGISFENWVKVKFREVQLSTKDEIQYRDEWVKANFL